MDYSLKKLLIATTTKNKPKYYFLKSAVMNQLKKQQNDRFYDYS